MAEGTKLNLGVDLQRGVVPISRAASQLAALLRKAEAEQRPIIVTQKGYPTGVLVSVALFNALKALAEGAAVPAETDEYALALDEA